MSASFPNVERRPVPAVAIVGNDAVLAAAPATPVQLAHACLQHGFSVAVPASWGDELLAAETVRRLLGREKGPAVMCVCPFVRSRLLASGPDLAPFLVSLVAPPVAAARYLRAAYGEHGVHITYIGTCPSADDPAIDARLTPDTFFADIADRGIALSEQPLVFDSIVPPDRRRWCSAPGGVPSPEVLWNEADARTLVEIDREDISTDLAQHIITSDNVLLDLAPGLGCACSGAIPSLPARSARVAVMALEPPRALGPVVESSSVIPLDAPVGTSPVPRPTAPGAPNAESTAVSDGRGLSADVLDLEIGRPVWNDDVAAGAAEPIRGSTGPSAAPSGTPDAPAVTFVAADVRLVPGGHWGDRAREQHTTAVDAPPNGAGGDISAMEASVVLPPAVTPTHRAVAERDTDTVIDPAGVIVAESDIETLVESLPDPPVEKTEANPESAETNVDSARPALATPEPITEVRRRTPVSVPARHPAAAIPRTTASGGKSLPRAYVAKRRTTPTGLMAVPNHAPPPAPAVPAEVTLPTTAPSSANPSVSDERVQPAAPLQQPAVRRDEVASSVPPSPSAAASGPDPTAGPAPASGRQPSQPSSSRPARAADANTQAPGSAAASSGGHRPLMIALVVAFVALAAFVVWTLRR